MKDLARGNTVLAIAILFFLLSWLTVSLRIYVRAALLRTWGKDDWAMLTTVLIFTVYLAFQMIAAVHGTGRHRWDLSDEDAKIALLFWYLCELLYVLSNCTLKIALGIFYLRVSIERWHIWCIRTLMAGTVLFGLVYFFLVMFQCLPISEFWNNHPATSKCIPRAPTLGITYALGIVNAFADWAFGILPFFIVWSLQMNLKTKILTVGILAFASIGSTATIVRMQYIKTLTNGEDFLYATVEVAIWSTVEPGIGITAGSMATLRPLLQTLLWRMGLASQPESVRRGTPGISGNSGPKRSRRGYRQSFEVLDLVPYDRTTSTIISGPPPRKKTWMTSTRSSERPAQKDKADDAIQQHVPIEQEIEGPPQLQLRDSLRYSFTRDTILSKKSPLTRSYGSSYA